MNSPASRPFRLSPEDWAALRRLLDEALALPAAQREAWLAALPAAQQALAPRLRALLAHADDADGGGDTGAAGRTGFGTLPRLAPLPAAGPEPAPPVAGPYRATRLLGEGGMGRVWLAERSDGLLHGRPVALKLPHAAAWHDPRLAERMAQEREILAVLDHPHIARIHDAGVTAEGQPYMALEYVEGERIDTYAQRHGLGLRERVALFLQVTDAVAHAHTRLVVHRDLKPSNVLVTADGQVRLLDFGIAKLLAADPAAAELTAPAQRAMTPQYAAPEQILGQPIGTAADIYSLGVVLYELLTGQLPYQPRRASAAALEETILDAEPPRPSQRAADPQARRALSGDLDTVLLKALKKNPAERYATVQAFADDLSNWLAQRPVQARPDSAWYHARKFVRRNWLPVSLAGGFVLSLGAALAAALWQAGEARQQAAKAGAITEFLVGLFRANDIEQADGLQKRQQSVQQLLERSADALGSGLADQPEVRADLRQIVGDLLADLEINDAAIRLQRTQAEDLSARGAPAPDQVAAWRALGQSLFRASDFDAARAALDRAACRQPVGERLQAQCLGVALDRAQIDRFEGKVDAAQAAADPLPAALARLPGTANDLADAYELLAQIRDLRNQPDEARGFFERALALRRAQWGEGSVRLAQMHYRFGRMLWNLRHLAEAEAEMRAAWQATRAALGPEHVASARNELHLGRLQFYVSAGGEGLAHLRHAHAALFAQADRLDPLELLTAQTFLANVLVLDGRLGEAGPALDAAAARRDQMGERAGASPVLALSRAQWLADSGRFAEARARLEAARDATIAQVGERHPYVADRRVRLAQALLAAGDSAAAQRELDAARATDDGIETVFGTAKHRARLLQALLWLGQGRAAEAAAEAGRMLALAARTDRRDVYRETVLLLEEAAAASLAALGRHDEAGVHYRRFVDELSASNPQHPWLAAVRAGYAASLQAQGRGAEARQQLGLARAALATEPLAGPQFRRPVLAAQRALAGPGPAAPAGRVRIAPANASFWSGPGPG
ncbi:MAG: serine/threonine-protein kinase [Burkholderiaceae bacterium]